MATSGTGIEWIILPKLNATALSAVIGRVLSEAEAQKKLPADVKERIELLTEAKADLTSKLAKRKPKKKVASDDPKAVEADNEEDKAVGALVTFLEAHAKRKGANAKAAQKVLDEVFGSGTKFLTLRHEEEWGEVEARIVQLDTEGHTETIEKLGGKLFVEDLRVAHKNYGEVLGITSARAAKESAPDVKGARNEAANQLRRLVAAVIGIGSKGDIHAVSAEVATALLAPIYEIRSKNAKRGAGGGSEDEEGDEEEGGEDEETEEGEPKPPGKGDDEKDE